MVPTEIQVVVTYHLQWQRGERNRRNEDDGPKAYQYYASHGFLSPCFAGYLTDSRCFLNQFQIKKGKKVRKQIISLVMNVKLRIS